MNRRDRTTVTLVTCRKQRCFVSMATGAVCNTTWDGWLCWDETEAGLTTEQSCPDYFKDFDPNGTFTFTSLSQVHLERWDLVCVKGQRSNSCQISSQRRDDGPIFFGSVYCWQKRMSFDIKLRICWQRGHPKSARKPASGDATRRATGPGPTLQTAKPTPHTTGRWEPTSESESLHLSRREQRKWKNWPKTSLTKHKWIKHTKIYKMFYLCRLQWLTSIWLWLVTDFRLCPCWYH